jgi:hypothetical protein
MCRCICAGRNHGILRFRGINVTPKTHDQRFEEWLGPPEQPKQIAPLRQLPHIQPKPKPEVPRERLIFPVARGTRKLFRKLTGITNQNDLNEAILKGLRHQFNQERIDSIIDQAFSIRQSKEPDRNRPELYELYETGEIDEALRLFNVRWVIGRPKMKR